jgi:2-dehydro-3-deoxyphosphogluconate aldolase / (4S)-4-hydroxy-2-oxoglutarate aldolase
VPVITIDRVDDGGSLAAALMAGGILYAEITFRTPAAAEAIDRMRSEAPQMIAGAGTVLSVEQADRAVRSGAQYVVSPAFDAAVVNRCEEHSVGLSVTAASF